MFRLLLGHLMLLRGLPHGVQWIFLLLIIVMAGDSGAYYVGMQLRQEKALSGCQSEQKR